MVLKLIGGIAAAFFLAMLSLSLPASAHENHQKERTEQLEKVGLPPPGVTPGAMQEAMEEHAEAMEEARPKSLPERMMSWLGRTHPFAVHFPIALFPVALVALVLARRRGETVELIRALIVVAGAAAVIAALLGWLTAGFLLVDDDPIQLWHRWIGTGLGFVGGLVALWAWRRRDSVYGAGMVTALGLITLTLLIQGWLGAVIVHGMEHMRF